MLLCSRGNVKPSGTYSQTSHEKFPAMLVTPTGESASHQSSVTLTSTKTADVLFPASATGGGLIFYHVLGMKKQI